MSEEKTSEEKDALYNEFLKKFPLENLGKMTLEQYTGVGAGQRDDFTYWLESRTDDIGSIWGGSSLKFKIYRTNKKPRKTLKCKWDGIYAWNIQAENKDEAFKLIKDEIIRIATLAANEQFDIIDSSNKIFSKDSVIKWKIAFLYSHKKILPIFSKDALSFIESSMKDVGEESPESPEENSTWELYRYILENSPKNISIWELGKEYWNDYKSNNSKRIFQFIKNNNNNMNTPTKTYIDLLTNSRNIILHGAPGTGKTYLARQIAESMGAETCFVQFHPSYDYTDFVEGLRPSPKEEDSDESSEIGFERKDGVFKKFCKKALLNSFINTVDNFEDSWKKLVETLINEERIEIPLIKYKTKTIKVELYYRSVEGLRSCEESPKFFHKDQLYKVYRGLPGVPMGGHDDYRKAIVQYMKDKYELKEYKPGEKSQENKNFVFIIDEINRGEMSKIFGELFFSIDPGYRGKAGAVKTQYSNMQQEPNDFDLALGHDKDGDYGHFFVPENVYIIGTMNDIDRNVESMDFAIRRRFAFKEITAADTQDMLDNHNWGENKPDIEAMKKRMTNLNNAISGIEGLSSAYHIGAAYFLKYDSSFNELWNYHLKPLLQEYLRGMDGAEQKLKDLEAAYNLQKQYDENGKEKEQNQQGQVVV